MVEKLKTLGLDLAMTVDSRGQPCWYIARSLTREDLASVEAVIADAYGIELAATGVR